MDRVLVQVGDRTYKCKVAKTEEDKKQGLMGVENLPADEGMLFEWDEEGEHSMWMKDTKIPLDQIAINDDEEVVMVYTAQPEDETLIAFPHSKYILEVNAGSGIQLGEEFDIDDETDLNKYQMKVIASDGTSQMLLQGGERIFSRKATRQFIKWAKKAELVKSDETKFTKCCKRLGKMMFKELKAQDERDPEYVKVPE